MRFNSEWLSKLDFAATLRLTRTTTVARLLERDDFAKRFAEQAPISMSELLYPLMQAYDSVSVEADVELGGTDQLFNLLAGREVMAAYGLAPQVALTVAYLDSWDGASMSASRGNYVGLKEAPEEQFGKVMRIPDELLDQWYRLMMEADGPPDSEPLDAKLALARFVVTRAHGEEAAAAAEAHFTRVVREGLEPGGRPKQRCPTAIRFISRPCSSTCSASARRVRPGGYSHRAECGWTTRWCRISMSRERLAGALLQAGKRRFVRFTSA